MLCSRVVCRCLNMYGKLSNRRSSSYRLSLALAFINFWISLIPLLTLALQQHGWKYKGDTVPTAAYDLETQKTVISLMTQCRDIMSSALELSCIISYVGYILSDVFTGNRSRMKNWMTESRNWSVWMVVWYQRWASCCRTLSAGHMRGLVLPMASHIISSKFQFGQSVYTAVSIFYLYLYLCNI